jgi:hypothetical protein
MGFLLLNAFFGNGCFCHFHFNNEPSLFSPRANRKQKFFAAMKTLCSDISVFAAKSSSRKTN